MQNARILVDGIGQPEGPRWHNGRLYYADMLLRRVCSVDSVGGHREEAALNDKPSGIGWALNGGMLVVSMTERRIVRIGDDEVRTEFDLASLTSDICNDMLITPDGHCYISTYALGEGATTEERVSTSRPTRLIHIDLQTGEISVAADGLRLPNGMCLTEDGRLLLAETGAKRILEFSVGQTGELSDRRTWAELHMFPDGICLDAEGYTWVAAPVLDPGFHRVAEGGEVERSVPCRPGAGGFACALGGDDGRDLFLLEAPAPPPDPDSRTGRILVARAPAPGAGHL